MVVLLVIGGVETNPGLQVEQVKTDQILVYTKNQEKEEKALKQMSETSKQEIPEMGKGTDVLGPKFKWLNEMANEVNNDYGQIKHAVRGC